MLRLVPVLAAAAAFAAASAAQAATPVTIKGDTGPGFKIEVESVAGKDVKSLKAGTYKLVVQDKASIHNFHLIGPGLNKVVTTVPFLGNWTPVTAPADPKVVLSQPNPAVACPLLLVCVAKAFAK